MDTNADRYLKPMSDADIADAAEEQILADIDEWQNWIGMHCASVPISHTRIVTVPPEGDGLDEFVESLDVPQLCALMLYPHRTAPLMALKRLRACYLAECAVPLAKLRSEIAANEAVPA